MLTGFLMAKTSILMKSQIGCNITKKKGYSLISSAPLGAVLPNDLFLFATKILYAFLIIFSAGCMFHPHDPSTYNHPEHKLWSSSLCSLLHPHVTSPFLGPKILQSGIYVVYLGVPVVSRLYMSWIVWCHISVTVTYKCLWGHCTILALSQLVSRGSCTHQSGHQCYGTRRTTCEINSFTVSLLQYWQIWFSYSINGNNSRNVVFFTVFKCVLPTKGI
jgi:hypothetical protein